MLSRDGADGNLCAFQPDGACRVRECPSRSWYLNASMDKDIPRRECPGMLMKASDICLLVLTMAASKMMVDPDS